VLSYNYIFLLSNRLNNNQHEVLMPEKGNFFSDGSFYDSRIDDSRRKTRKFKLTPIKLDTHVIV
jgi:hypothetical protein